MKRNLAAIGLFLLLVAHSPCLADSETDLVQSTQTTERRDLRLLLGIDYTQFSVNGSTLSGAGLEAGVLYGVSRRVGVGMSLKQGFTDTLAALFTSIDLNFTFSITGNMALQRQISSIEGRDMVTTQTLNTGGWYGHLYTEEYFINTTEKLVSFPGLGVGLSYELPSSTTANFSFGVRLDRLSNDVQNLYPIQGFIRYSLWM